MAKLFFLPFFTPLYTYMNFKRHLIYIHYYTNFNDGYISIYPYLSLFFSLSPTLSFFFSPRLSLSSQPPEEEGFEMFPSFRRRMHQRCLILLILHALGEERSNYPLQHLARVRTSLALILEKWKMQAPYLETLPEVKRGIGRAVRSGSVVLKKFEDLHDLQPCLLADPLSDLAGFLAALWK